MKHLPLFLISLLLPCAFGCGSKHQSVETDTMAYDKSDFTGTWLIVEYGVPIPPSTNGTITFAMNGSFFDSVEDGPFSYDIKGGRLVIENLGWGKQEFNIVKLTRDSLHLQLYRHQIYSDSIDVLFLDRPIEKYVRLKNNFER